MTDDVLQRLVALIKSRREDSADKSYTRQLLDAGVERCAKKLGEEAVETVIAGVGQSEAALTAEAADLLYHLLVLLECAECCARRRLARSGGAHGHIGPRGKG